MRGVISDEYCDNGIFVAVPFTSTSQKMHLNTRDRTHMIAAHMGQGAPKDMLVTFVIAADDGQCHKNPIVTIIVGNKRFRKVAHCNETGGLPTGRNPRSYSPFQTTPDKTT